MKESYYIGVDLGGTNVKAGIVRESGEIIAKVHQDCPTGEGDEAIISTIERAVRLAMAEGNIGIDQVNSIGVGTPGIANAETGVVEYSCNLNFHDTPLGGELSRRFGKEVLIENDANVAALGELYAGAGKGCKSMVAITIGTGIGGGVIVNGHLLTGFNFAGAELGHTVIVQGGQLCGCGRQGCFEAYASATALIRQTREAMNEHPESKLWQVAQGDLSKVDGRTPFAAQELGDETAQQVLRTYAGYLATGITNMVNIFQPEVVCVGGGVSNAGEALLAPVREIFDREDYARDSKNRCKLVIASLGNDAGIIGAAMLTKFR
jgi:glucokinase